MRLYVLLYVLDNKWLYITYIKRYIYRRIIRSNRNVNEPTLSEGSRDFISPQVIANDSPCDSYTIQPHTAFVTWNISPSHTLFFLSFFFPYSSSPHIHFCTIHFSCSYAIFNKIKFPHTNLFLHLNFSFMILLFPVHEVYNFIIRFQ